jgi:basic membrane protein A
MERAAELYPDVYFLHASGTGHRSNLASFFGRMYQARYLSGIIAGMKTKTGHLGYVAAFPLPEVIRGLNAFTLGVRSVRPDAVVHVRYCQSWTDDDAAGLACARLLERHPIDVVSVHTNSLAPHREADRRGQWSLGYNLDNALAFPNTYLSACVWNWDVYYRRQIRDCLQGKFHGTHVWPGMEDGIVAISPPTNHVDARTRERVQAAYEKIRNRTFDVFYGPLKDNAGHIRVAEGESMSDTEMLNGFYWYVEGVKIEGQ